MSDPGFQQQQLGDGASSSCLTANSFPPSPGEPLVLPSEASSIQTLITVVRLAYSRAKTEEQKILEVQRRVDALCVGKTQSFVVDYLETSYRRRLRYYIESVKRDIKQVNTKCDEFERSRSEIILKCDMLSDIENITDSDSRSSNGNRRRSSSSSSSGNGSGSRCRKAVGKNKHTNSKYNTVMVNGDSRRYVLRETVAPLSVAHNTYLTALSHLLRHVEILRGLMERTADVERLAIQIGAILEELPAFMQLMEELEFLLVYYRTTSSPYPMLLFPSAHQSPVPSQTTFRDFLRRVFGICFGLPG